MYFSSLQQSTRLTVLKLLFSEEAPLWRSHAILCPVIAFDLQTTEGWCDGSASNMNTPSA